MNIAMRFKAALTAVAVFSSFFMSSAQACEGDFYVIWIEGEATTNVYVRSLVVNGPGIADQYGIMNMPDSSLGVDNPLYMFGILKDAFVQNTKVEIETDDTDCEISFDGESLGTIIDVQAADL